MVCFAARHSSGVRMADDENRTEFTTIIVDDSKSLRRALEELDVRINASMKEGWNLSGAVIVGITRSAGYDFPLVSQSMTRQVRRDPVRGSFASEVADRVVRMVTEDMPDSDSDFHKMIGTASGRREFAEQIRNHWSSR